jgi:hypothetical protein
MIVTHIQVGPVRLFFCFQLLMVTLLIGLRVRLRLEILIHTLNICKINIGAITIGTFSFLLKRGGEGADLGSELVTIIILVLFFLLVVTVQEWLFIGSGSLMN